MEYTFRAYKLVIPDWKKIKHDFFQHVYTMNISGDKLEGRYGFVEVNNENVDIYGYFAQESIEDFVKYENKQPMKLEDYPWIRTVFIIDCEKLIVYVHKKKYASKFLTHGKVLRRLQQMLSDELNQQVLLIPYYAGLDKENFKKVFYDENNTIKEIQFSDLQGSVIINGTQLHNPRKELDELRAESHNRYDAKILKNAWLQANEGENLSKSPTARAFLEGTSSVGSMIRYKTKSGSTIVEYSKAQAKIKVDIDDEVSDINKIYLKVRHEIDVNIDYINRTSSLDYIDKINGLTDEEE
jgi:hypothetical protein